MPIWGSRSRADCVQSFSQTDKCHGSGECTTITKMPDAQGTLQHYSLQWTDISWRPVSCLAQGGTQYVSDERMSKCYTSLPVSIHHRPTAHRPTVEICSTHTNEQIKSICFCTRDNIFSCFRSGKYSFIQYRS